MDTRNLPILDCHQHFYDSRRLRYPVFEGRSLGFEELVGDYSAMPRVYLPQDYAEDIEGLNVVQTVWAEFLSVDPMGEVKWAEELAQPGGWPNGMIAQVDFLGDRVEQVLNDYAAMPHVRCVRGHLGWHPTNPLLRFAARPALLLDDAWRRGVAKLRPFGLVCEIEIFSSQLTEFASLVAANADIQFVLPVMGWPIDLSKEGELQWRSALERVSVCPNVALKIFGMECIFGLDWTKEQVRPWILRAIEAFGPSRAMFASHLPIGKLSRSAREIYEAYFEIIDDFSMAEKRQLLHDTAAAIYRLPVSAGVTGPVAPGRSA